MATRNSEYTRLADDNYETPAWVVQCLLATERFSGPVLEPCAGSGAMAAAIRAGGYDVITHANGYNFLDDRSDHAAVITNPPWDRRLAPDIVRHALRLTEAKRGRVTMLFPATWPAARGRRDIFQHRAFAKYLYLPDRVRWANLEQKAARPSSDTVWLLWDHANRRPPTIGWLS